MRKVTMIDEDAVLLRLEQIASACDVPYQHWLGGDAADQGLSYCHDCASKRVEAGEGEYIAGGFEQDDDGCRHCEDCGRLLEYTLTDYGVEAEFDFFKGDRMRRRITPEVAYMLTRVLEKSVAHPEVLSLLTKVSRALDRSPHAVA